MQKYYKVDFNNSGVGFIDPNGFYIIKKSPYQPPIYRLNKRCSTWLIKLKLKYPSPKPRKSKRMTIREYVAKNRNPKNK